jgi:hypothetical protein
MQARSRLLFELVIIPVVPLFFMCSYENAQKTETKAVRPTTVQGGSNDKPPVSTAQLNEKALNESNRDINKAHLTGITSTSHYIQDDLPVGHVKNGTVDYTRYVQRAIDRYDNLVFPSFPILINDSGLRVGSNKTITFVKGSEVWLKPSAKKSYNMIDLREASNVMLYNPVIKGDRYSHLGADGEFGMGIAIRGGKKIKIFNPKISECWGDGIYIGQTNNDRVPKDILISGAHLSKNRRDGISIISVDGLILDEIYAGYQNGTKPMCGINFEPNNSDCEIKNVKIISPRTEYNNGSGLQIILSNLFIAHTDKKIDIDILNHSDNSSKSFAFKTACNNRGRVPAGSVSGSIKVLNPSWSGTIGDRPLAFVTDQPDLKVIIVSPKVKKSNGMELSSSAVKAILNKHSNGDLRIL